MYVLCLPPENLVLFSHVPARTQAVGGQKGGGNST